MTNPPRLFIQKKTAANFFFDFQEENEREFIDILLYSFPLLKKKSISYD